MSERKNIKRPIRRKLRKEVVFPPEGLRQAENVATSCIKSNWYDCRELIPGKLLWGLPIISGNSRRAAYTECLASKGELFDFEAELQMPSGLIVRAEMWHQNKAELSGEHIQIVFNEEDNAGVIQYFKQFAEDTDHE